MRTERVTDDPGATDIRSMRRTIPWRWSGTMGSMV